MSIVKDLSKLAAEKIMYAIETPRDVRKETLKVETDARALANQIFWPIGPILASLANKESAQT